MKNCTKCLNNALLAYVLSMTSITWNCPFIFTVCHVSCEMVQMRYIWHSGISLLYECEI